MEWENIWLLLEERTYFVTIIIFYFPLFFIDGMQFMNFGLENLVEKLLGNTFKHLSQEFFQKASRISETKRKLCIWIYEEFWNIS